MTIYGRPHFQTAPYPLSFLVCSTWCYLEAGADLCCWWLDLAVFQQTISLSIHIYPSSPLPPPPPKKNIPSLRFWWWLTFPLFWKISMFRSRPVSLHCVAAHGTLLQALGSAQLFRWRRDICCGSPSPSYERPPKSSQLCWNSLLNYGFGGVFDIRGIG